MVDQINLLNCQVYREAICHPCRINEGEEFTISWADGGPEVKVQMFNKKDQSTQSLSTRWDLSAASGLKTSSVWPSQLPLRRPPKPPYLEPFSSLTSITIEFSPELSRYLKVEEWPLNLCQFCDMATKAIFHLCPPLTSTTIRPQSLSVSFLGLSLPKYTYFHIMSHHP